MVRLKVIVHFPEEQNAIAVLQETAAKIHAEAVISCMQNSSLSAVQADRAVDIVLEKYQALFICNTLLNGNISVGNLLSQNS